MKESLVFFWVKWERTGLPHPWMWAAKAHCVTRGEGSQFQRQITNNFKRLNFYTIVFNYYPLERDFRTYGYIFCEYCWHIIFPKYWNVISFSVQLRAPMILNRMVSLAPLPRQGTGVVAGHMCRVSGWGYDNQGGVQGPVTLRTVHVPVVSTAKCNSSDSFDGNITANMICAGHQAGGKDACKVKIPWMLRDIFI